jgi:imidazole glycerol-phosphate synthase subunit HisH
MTTCIVNYESGNLGSVMRALRAINARVLIADTPRQLAGADRLILPGVGNFRETMERLHAGGWVEVLRSRVLEAGRPLLGICVGMQVLAEAGTESSPDGNPTPGLGLVRGTVQRLDAFGCGLRIPQQGWNSLERTGEGCPLLDRIPDGTDFYFSNSYALPADSSPAVAAVVDYGVRITAAVAAGSVMGIQFHPEKSSRAGLRVLRNFMEFPC